jgi:guanylate cyclase
MESHGTSGRIQITRATKELLDDEFVCEPRGAIQVKGKGEMEAWYLVGHRVSPAVESRAEPESVRPEVVPGS